tara:strand:- start:793 stop:1002 length:210 start_codon:yes stop_codon:yes gene_type:complete
VFFLARIEEKKSDTKKNTDDKKEQEKKETKQKFKEQPSIHRERERETTVLNTMECYFFVLRKYKQTHKS